MKKTNISNTNVSIIIDNGNEHMSKKISAELHTNEKMKTFFSANYQFADMSINV